MKSEWLLNLEDRILELLGKWIIRMEITEISLFLVWIASFLIIINEKGTIDPPNMNTYGIHSLIQIILIINAYWISIYRLHEMMIKTYYKYLLFIPLTYLFILSLLFTSVSGSFGMLWIYTQVDIYLVALKQSGILLAFIGFFQLNSLLLKKASK